jgi:tetratricopeptide (TPR) repeat protein
MQNSQQVPAEPFRLLKEGQELQFQNPPDYAAAERSYRKAMELAPDWGEPAHWLASVLHAQNKLEESCEVERRAIELLPSDPRPLVGLGWTLRVLGKYKEAVPFFEKGLELKPHYGEADARFMLAEVYEQLGQINDAATLWRQIIGMDSMYPSYDQPMEEAKKKLAEHGLTVKG